MSLLYDRDRVLRPTPTPKSTASSPMGPLSSEVLDSAVAVVSPPASSSAATAFFFDLRGAGDSSLDEAEGLLLSLSVAGGLLLGSPPAPADSSAPVSGAAASSATATALAPLGALLPS